MQGSMHSRSSQGWLEMFWLFLILLITLVLCH